MLAAHSFSISKPSNRACSLGCSRVQPGRSRTCQLRATASSSSTAITRSEPLRVWLVAKEVEKGVQLEVMPDGKGQAVVVVDVEPGSSAAEAGIVRGQRLLGISDPVRDTEIMDMGDRPSLRFVRDTLRMRRMGQVQLVIGDWLNVTDPAWGAVGSTPQQTNSLGEAGASMDDGSSLPSNIRASFLSEGEDENTNMTVGERMAAQYEARERATRQVTDVKKRIAKRAAYMDEVSQRNDSPLVVGLAVAFIAPAAIILAIAAGTGYLDKLYSASLTIN